MKRCILMVTLGVLACLGITANGQAFFPRFSLDPASPSVNGNITPDDILSPGPTIYIQGNSLGLKDKFFTGNFDSLNDISFGQDPITPAIFFTVDRVAVGLPGSAVFAKAQPSVADAARHIYVSLPPVGSNAIAINGDQLGLQPGLLGDEANSVELNSVPKPWVYFTIDKQSASNGFGSGTLATDILVSKVGQPFHVYADGVSQIGLMPGDNISGLALLDPELDDIANPGDKALFTLTPFSPTVLSGKYSSADILFTRFDGTFTLWAPAASIGMRRDDYVVGLDTAVVPEPGGGTLFGAGLLSAALWVRKRPRR